MMLQSTSRVRFVSMTCGERLAGFCHLAALLDEGENFLLRLGSEHSDTRLTIIGNAFEERRCSKMSADMKNATKLGALAILGVEGILCRAVDADCDLPLEDVYLVVEGKRLLGMCYLVEYPRTAKGGATYHHGINTIALKGEPSLFR